MKPKTITLLVILLTLGLTGIAAVYLLHNAGSSSDSVEETKNDTSSNTTEETNESDKDTDDKNETNNTSPDTPPDEISSEPPNYGFGSPLGSVADSDIPIVEICKS